MAETKINEYSFNRDAPRIMKERIDYLMDNGARSITGEFSITMNEVPTMKITAELLLLDYHKSGDIPKKK